MGLVSRRFAATSSSLAFVAWLAAVAACAGACAEFSSADDSAKAPTGDASSDAEDAATAVSTDGGSDAVTVPDGAREASSTSVTITAASGARFALGATEVTVAEFRAFKKTFDAPAGFANCPAKIDLGPKMGCSATTDDGQPITCVDFCDARSYCVSVGKRLCGKIGGGPGNSATPTDPTEDPSATRSSGKTPATTTMPARTACCGWVVQADGPPERLRHTRPGNGDDRVRRPRLSLLPGSPSSLWRRSST